MVESVSKHPFNFLKAKRRWKSFRQRKCKRSWTKIILGVSVVTVRGGKKLIHYHHQGSESGRAVLSLLEIGKEE